MVRCNMVDEMECAAITKPQEEEKCILHPCSVTADDELRENEIQSVLSTNSIQSNKLYSWRTEHWSSVRRCIYLLDFNFMALTICFNIYIKNK